MSEETEGSEELPLILVAGGEEGPALRWTPATVLIDAGNAVATVLEGIAGFFRDQARSGAAAASLREELQDQSIRQQLREDARRRMRLHTMEDIAHLPETTE
jgi:hypothetical protein